MYVGWFKKYMLSNFPNFDPFLSFFAYFKQSKKYITKQWLFAFRQIAPSEPTYFLNDPSDQEKNPTDR